MRRMLLCILEAVEGRLCWKVSEVMRCVSMLEAVEAAAKPRRVITPFHQSSSPPRRKPPIFVTGLD